MKYPGRSLLDGAASTRPPGMSHQSRKINLDFWESESSVNPERLCKHVKLCTSSVSPGLSLNVSLFSSRYGDFLKGIERLPFGVGHGTAHSLMGQLQQAQICPGQLRVCSRIEDGTSG